MKNRILCLLTICICTCISMFGESDDTKVIKPLEATSSDYISLLTANGYEAFPFDISSLSNGQYNITFKIKEYRHKQEIRDNVLGRYPTYQNMDLLSEYPEEDQENTKPEEMADPDRGIYHMAQKVMVGFIPIVNDSIRPILMEVENMGSSSSRLQMLPQYENNDSVNGKKLYLYLPKPFKTQELKTGQFIPLVLYGSFWYDKDFGFHRFCGENELNPDMSSEILKYIPHYYIIGIEVNLITML